MDQPTTKVGDAVWRLAFIMVPAWALLPLTFLFPPLDATDIFLFDLTGWVGVVAYGLSLSGSTRGIPWIAMALLALLISRIGLSRRRRMAEALAIFVTLVVLQVGGAYVNEYIVKPQFHLPRPYLVQLGNTPRGAPAARTVLQKTVEAFYALDRGSRRAYLEGLADPDAGCFETVRVHAAVCRHWISTVGYSFPSGHAFIALSFATFFLGLALVFLTRRRWLFMLLAPWAVLVSFSRPVLRVHSFLDITVGGLAGLVLGFVGFLVVYRVLRHIGGGRWA